MFVKMHVKYNPINDRSFHDCFYEAEGCSNIMRRPLGGGGGGGGQSVRLCAKGWAINVKIPSYIGGGGQICRKKCHMIIE